MVNRYLQWSTKGTKDNLVSWTNSLLYALDVDRQECSPSRTKIAACGNTLPEVQDYQTIMRGIYLDYSFNQLKGGHVLDSFHFWNAYVLIFT